LNLAVCTLENVRLIHLIIGYPFRLKKYLTAGNKHYPIYSQSVLAFGKSGRRLSLGKRICPWNCC